MRCLPQSQSAPGAPATGTRSIPPLRDRSLLRKPPAGRTASTPRRYRRRRDDPGGAMTTVDAQASDDQQRGDQVLADLFFTPEGIADPAPQYGRLRDNAPAHPTGRSEAQRVGKKGI